LIVCKDKLDQALQQRPKPEELVKEGILKGKCSLMHNLTHPVDLQVEDEVPATT
jgi:RPEL repeat